MKTNETMNERNFFKSKTARLLMVVVLVLILMIPLELVKSLIKEREHRQSDVVSEISEKWGEPILFYGPILKVPYIVYKESEQYNQDTKEKIKVRTKVIKNAFLFPKTLHFDFDVNNQTLYRGNYQAVVFNSKIDCNASFDTIALEKYDISEENIMWDKATVLIKTSNLRSINEEVYINYDNIKVLLEPVHESGSRFLQTLKSDDLNLSQAKSINQLNFSVDFNGSQSIRLVPIGKTTTSKMISNWGDPSFTGSFLPIRDSKEISNDGFFAEWKVLHLNRPFGQTYLGDLPELESYSFGVDFKILNDDYQQSERASKYGLLVIALTFLTFFMIQVINNLKVHIVQYSLIGAALVIFYALLISISEHSSFKLAYFTASISIIVMITLYSFSFFKRFSQVSIIASSLMVLYVFIYIIIQLDNYALLAGSVGLFVILALIMYFSRKVNWEQ